MGKKVKLEAAGSVGTGSTKQDPLQALDFGDWCEIALIINVTQAGGGTLSFETGAEPFEGAFAPIADVSVSLTSVAVSFKYIARKHARYLRWITDSVSGTPKFTIDAYAKIRG